MLSYKDELHPRRSPILYTRLWNGSAILNTFKLSYKSIKMPDTYLVTVFGEFLAMLFIVITGNIGQGLGHSYKDELHRLEIPQFCILDYGMGPPF